jgi:hypothetical protein
VGPKEFCGAAQTAQLRPRAALLSEAVAGLRLADPEFRTALGANVELNRSFGAWLPEGVRSLLQSISIFRMREMEDARSLAGLAMEVYSDRISIEQDEQERLRFSPDDILRLPVHQAINLWIAGGVPCAGFVGHTLPMEDLHDANLVEHHLHEQRARGGHHPTHLGDPLEEHNAGHSAPRDDDVSVDGEQASEATRDESQPSPDPRRNGSAPEGQMAFDEMSDELDD